MRPRLSLVLAATTLVFASLAAAPPAPGPSAPAHAPAPTGHSEPAGDASSPASPSGAHDGAGGHTKTHGPEIKLPFTKTPLGPVGQWMVQLFNFLLFTGILVFALKGILGAAFKARAEELRDLLSQAERDKADSEAQIRDMEARAATLQTELDQMLARAELDAEAEKQRILDTARQEADQVLAQARQEIDYQKRLAEQELRILVTELAAAEAARRLQADLQGPAAATVMDRAIQQVGASS